MSNKISYLLLVLVAAIWGGAFVAQKRRDGIYGTAQL